MQVIKHDLEVESNTTLHIAEFIPNHSNKIVLFVHGAVENGKIFYSSTGRGLAPYLSKNNIHGYVVDLRGKGLSRPRLARGVNFNQDDVIEDLSKVIDWIASRHPNKKLNIISHSWGGVFVQSTLLKHVCHLNRVESHILLGVKRSIQHFSLKKILYINLIFDLMGKLHSSLKGYLPARPYGSDAEAISLHRDMLHWIYSKRWLDTKNGIDYYKLARVHELPKSFYLIGEDDHTFGRESDVYNFMRECNHKGAIYHLGETVGFKVNYGHIDMLTHKQATSEVYPLILKLLHQ